MNQYLLQVLTGILDDVPYSGVILQKRLPSPLQHSRPLLPLTELLTKRYRALEPHRVFASPILAKATGTWCKNIWYSWSYRGVYWMRHFTNIMRTISPESAYVGRRSRQYNCPWAAFRFSFYLLLNGRQKQLHQLTLKSLLVLLPDDVPRWFCLHYHLFYHHHYYPWPPQPPQDVRLLALDPATWATWGIQQ